MRRDIIFNYDYLLDIIQKRYKANTLNQSIQDFCKDIYYLAPYRFKAIVIDKRAYFLQSEIYKIANTLNLNANDIDKCFFTIQT